MVPEAWLLRLAVWVDCEGARVHLLPGTLEGGERWTMSGGEVHAHREVRSSGADRCMHIGR